MSIEHSSMSKESSKKPTTPTSKSTSPSSNSESPSSDNSESPSQQSDEGKDVEIVTQDFQFVSYSPAGSSKSRSSSSRSLVRSQAARHQWKQDLPSRTARRADRSRRRKPNVQVVLEGVESSSEPSSESEMSSHGSSNSPVLPPMELLVGGARVDPFNSFPAQWKPYFPAVVDHYLTHMAVDIPELDQETTGAMRSNFFPLILSEPSIFLTVILLGYSHYSSVRRVSGATDLLLLKQEALESINGAIRRYENTPVPDALIGSVAKMASYEAMYGNTSTYQAHMTGLKRMIELRGGLFQLGLGGLLRRVIIWIDINASFLLKVPLFFPNEIFAEMQATIQPSPLHFIGNSE